MGLLDFDWIRVGGAGDRVGQLWYDGTYIWFTRKKTVSNDKHLFRLRPSDKALIKPDGSVGDMNTAGVYFDSYAAESFCVSDGTTVIVGNYWGGGFYRFAASDMSSLGGALEAATGIGQDCTRGTFDGTYFWLTGNYPGPPVQGIFRINPATWVVTKYQPSMILTDCLWDGSALWVWHRSSAAGINKINPATGAVLLTVSDLTASPAMGFDPVLGEIWTALTGAECARFRISDGAWINQAGAVGTYASSVVSGYETGASGGIFVAADHVFTSGTSSNMTVQRRQIKTGVGLPSAGYWSNFAGLPGGFQHSVKVGDTVYASIGSQGGSTVSGPGIMWVTVDSPIPNLTNIAITTGPIVSLTFNNSVSISGTTIGPPLGKLDIPSVGMSDTTHLQIALTVSPPVLTTVGGNLSDVQLTFDEAITYAGAWTQTPGGANFILAQPTFDGTNTLLTVPIVAGASIPRYLTAAQADATGILLNYDGPILIDGAIGYGTQVNGVRIVSGSQPDANSVHLVAAFANSGTSEWIPTPQSVTGVGVLPYVAAAYADSSTSFVLIFSEEVTESSATNPANYGIVPALDIMSISRVSGNTYRMVTSIQTAGTTYEVTLTGVVDRANNPI